jgi:hypothetical protein
MRHKVNQIRRSEESLEVGPLLLAQSHSSVGVGAPPVPRTPVHIDRDLRRVVSCGLSADAASALVSVGSALARVVGGAARSGSIVCGGCSW